MRPSEILKLIEARVNAKIVRPVLLEGSPGLGKTQLAEQAAQKLGIDFKVIHAPLLQPEDYGFPVISKDRDNVDFIVSKSKFPVEGSDCPDAGVFLIDELPQADNSAQKILANLLQAREIHGQKLKKNWVIIATGNKTTDRAGANRLLSHLNDRITKIHLDVSLDDWTNWALEHGIKTEVIAFIRFRPELLSHFDPHADKSPTPRAWSEGVSAALGTIDPKHELEVFKGDVGEGPAAEFVAFLKVYRKLPNVDTILLDPKKVEVPTDPATLYALCGALAHKATGDNFGRIMTYIERMPTEFSVLFVRDVMKRKPEIQNTSDFIKWASGPGAKLLT